MSAIYDLFETPSPNKEEKQPLHARIVSKGTVDKEEFLDRVHKFTGISRSLLAGAMEAFANEARDLLADGWNVEMGNFGFFSTSLQCPPVKDKKEIRAASVQMKNINFRASRPFNTYLENHLFISRTDYSHLTGRNKKVAIEELNSFITDRIIQKEGVGKLTVYIKV